MMTTAVTLRRRPDPAGSSSDHVAPLPLSVGHLEGHPAADDPGLPGRDHWGWWFNRFRIWGRSDDLRRWLPLDVWRPIKSTLVTLDVPGTRPSPAFTPLRVKEFLGILDDTARPTSAAAQYRRLQQPLRAADRGLAQPLSRCAGTRWAASQPEPAPGRRREHTRASTHRRRRRGNGRCARPVPGQTLVQLDAGLRAGRHDAADGRDGDLQPGRTDTQFTAHPVGFGEFPATLGNVDQHVGPEPAHIVGIPVDGQLTQAGGAQQVDRAEVDESARRRGEPGQRDDVPGREHRRVGQGFGRHRARNPNEPGRPGNWRATSETDIRCWLVSACGGSAISRISRPTSSDRAVCTAGIVTGQFAAVREGHRHRWDVARAGLAQRVR